MDQLTDRSGGASPPARNHTQLRSCHGGAPCRGTHVVLVSGRTPQDLHSVWVFQPPSLSGVRKHRGHHEAPSLDGPGRDPNVGAERVGWERSVLRKTHDRAGCGCCFLLSFALVRPAPSHTDELNRSIGVFRGRTKSSDPPLLLRLKRSHT